jgi:hypothetical protein
MAFPTMAKDRNFGLKSVIVFECKAQKLQYYQQYCGENLKTDDTSYHEMRKIRVSEF